MSQSTGVPAVDTLVIWSVAAVALAAGGALLWRWARGLRRVAQRVEDFVDDWQGARGRPGVPARAGVMERLDVIERGLEEVRREVRPNGGSSMRDAINRVDERTRQLTDDEE